MPETVVSNTTDFEIVDASSGITTGYADALFYTLEFTPNVQCAWQNVK